jgi:hypothetical protein
MIDLPNFVLSSLKEFCPPDACIQRVDQFRFIIQSRNAGALSLSASRPKLELVMGESLIRTYQGAIAAHDQTALAAYAESIREQVAKQLDDSDGDAQTLIQLL